MDTQEVTLTPEDRKQLEDELALLEGDKRSEIIAQLQEARGFGDLSENAEYDAAKEAQSQNEARINEIRHLLATAKVVENRRGAKSIAIGSTVELVDEKGTAQTYTLAGTTHTDSLQNKISNVSPLGAALIGHVAGDTVSFETPSGKTRSLTVKRINR